MNQTSFNHATTHIDPKKKKQIDTLKSLKEEICVVRPDLYHIPLTIVNCQFLLKIQLTEEFPKSQPLIWIYPVPCHNWITEQGRIMSPGLVNYSQNSELGCLVHEIIREMKKSITSPNYPLIKGYANEHPILPSAKPNTYNQLYAMPAYIPELESLSGEKLKLLNENEDMLDDFVAKLPLAVEYSKELDSQQQQLENLTVAVDHSKRNVKTQQQKLMEHYAVLKQMKEHWDFSYGQHQELAQRYIPNNIEASLHAAATVVDEQSEETAEKFLSGQIDIDAFLSTYLPSRSLFHLRKTKEEILNKQLQELQRSAGYY